MIIKLQLKIGYEKTYNTLLFSSILQTMNKSKTYISSSETIHLHFFSSIIEENKREMRTKRMSLYLIVFFFINKRKTHTNECEKTLQYIKNKK